jgi:aryl-alcohol dehydrogenase-like predicted oxidoreductase
VIERAADFGINHFDTARSYQGGNNERMVGAALKKWVTRTITRSADRRVRGLRLFVE